MTEQQDRDSGLLAVACTRIQHAWSLDIDQFEYECRARQIASGEPITDNMRQVLQKHFDVENGNAGMVGRPGSVNEASEYSLINAQLTRLCTTVSDELAGGLISDQARQEHIQQFLHWYWRMSRLGGIGDPLRLEWHQFIYDGLKALINWPSRQGEALSLWIRAD